MTQQDFIAMASGATQTGGPVVRYAVVPGFEYSGQPGAGHRPATGFVTMLAAQGTVVTRERSPMTLIREENTSIQPGVAQTPPEDREYGYLDQGNDTYILAQWNPEYP
jgi:hypothetical protein